MSSYKLTFNDRVATVPNWAGYVSYPQQGPTWATANINGQIWMAENLAYDDGGEGIHHEGVTANGVDLGEQYYYNSAAMIRISSHFPGWHLPNYNEVTALSSFGTRGNYNKLRSEEGWSITPGTNEYGFNLYPAGNYNCVDAATGMLDGISTQANILLTHSVGFARARFTDAKRTSNISDLTAAKAWGWWYNVRLIKDPATGTLTSKNVNVTFNDGSWEHGGDFGFVIDSSLSDWCNVLNDKPLSAIIEFTSDFDFGMDEENIRYSYDSNNIPDENYCGHWYIDNQTHTMTAIISGFGNYSASPTTYPVYISMPYTNRDRGEHNPILFSGVSGS